MSTSELASVAYRLDLSAEEWIRALARVLSSQCRSDISLAYYGGQDLRLITASSDPTFFSKVNLDAFVRRETSGSDVLEHQNGSSRRVAWVFENGDAILCAAPHRVSSSTQQVWASFERVVRPALTIRSALYLDGGPSNPRQALGQVIARATEVADVAESERTTLVQTVWDGVLDGRWSLIDIQANDGAWHLVAHKNNSQRDPRALSHREKQVVRLAAMGLSNKEISYKLGVSQSSVASFLRRAMEKLRIESRAQLVIIAGILGVPEDLSDRQIEATADAWRIVTELDRLFDYLHSDHAIRQSLNELRLVLRQHDPEQATD